MFQSPLILTRRDPEGIFAEPVTDDIAPGYSSLIKHPMDLSTMATKLSNHTYTSLEEFKSDFVLMCKNAMTYNSRETVYHSIAHNTMQEGLKIIEKVRVQYTLSETLTFPYSLNFPCAFVYTHKVMSWCVESKL